MGLENCSANHDEDVAVEGGTTRNTVRLYRGNMRLMNMADVSITTIWENDAITDIGTDT